MNGENLIPTELRVKAVGSLQEEIDRELRIPDPSSAKANEILKGNKKNENKDN